MVIIGSITEPNTKKIPSWHMTSGLRQINHYNLLRLLPREAYDIYNTTYKYRLIQSHGNAYAYAVTCRLQINKIIIKKTSNNII